MMGISPLLTAAATRLPELMRLRHGPGEPWGWGPRLRAKFGHATPAEWYEALVFSLVTPRTRWLDVGCGRFVFDENERVARTLADRCAVLVGIDPDANIEDNRVVHERVRVPVEAYRPERLFDLITLKMVAEHIETPEEATLGLARLLAPGGRVVVYTVPKWSPASMVAAMTPLWFHHLVKRILWRAEERDTFATFYRMNTRGELRRLFRGAGLDEEMFAQLGDCRSTNRWKLLNTVELAVEWAMRRLGLCYPERCILGVYRKPG